jgi:phosphate transport system substrate-binding protein
MKKLGKLWMSALLALAAVTVLAVFAGPAMAATYAASGATFPAPLYQKWASDYASTGTQINYTGVGSGAGQAAIKAGTVDFAGSDQPLTKGQLTAAGLVQFPGTIGGVVPIVNISGVGSGKLRLTGPVLAKIFLGDVTMWNSKQIKALNPGLSLPASQITVVHRSDSSGTSWIFTNYLGLMLPEWRGGPGISTAPAWTAGVGAKGSDGVAALVKSTPNSIGYVEYAYAKTNAIPWVQLRNRTGKWVQPNLITFAAAASQATWSSKNGFYTLLVNQKGAKAWPITGATWILMKKNQKSQADGKAILKFFNWAYTTTSAKASAVSLAYVSIPKPVVAMIQTFWAKNIAANGSPCWP